MSCQLIRRQIAFVIQNKHGCHTAHRTGGCQEAVICGRKTGIPCPGADPVKLYKSGHRFPPAARAAEVEMSRYRFNARTTRDADLHLPHLFSLCPFMVTELIDQRPWLRASRKGAKGQMEGRAAVGKNS